MKHLRKIIKFNSLLTIILSLIFITNTVALPLNSPIKVNTSHILQPSLEILLPPPQSINVSLEESLFQRMSIRGFTPDPITETQLATILWAAYGKRLDATLTIPPINNTNAMVLYVLKEDAAYTYNSQNHSLQFYKTGDWRDTVGWQHTGAAVVLGLCWNTTLTSPNEAVTELGCAGQNIALTTGALTLGTVVTGEFPPAIDRMGIPEDQQGFIIMPIGHLKNPYNFKYRPWWLSLLPRITPSNINLSSTIATWKYATTYTGEISRSQLHYLLWTAYGYSYYLDQSTQEKNPVVRHRTVPSAHGYYPLIFYAITETGVYKYQPNLLPEIVNSTIDLLGIPILTFFTKISGNDVRATIAQATTLPESANAPLIIAAVLDRIRAKDLAPPPLDRCWYFEAGAASQNILLGATTMQYSGGIAQPRNYEDISSALQLNNDQIPLLCISINTQQ